jgi:hypothetical protein
MTAYPVMNLALICMVGLSSVIGCWRLAMRTYGRSNRKLTHIPLRAGSQPARMPKMVTMAYLTWSLYVD